MNPTKASIYSGKLLPVEVGQIITVTGKTSESAERFDIFLGSDEGLSDDFGSIQFHAAVKFTTASPEIARNAYDHGFGWGKEEIEENLLANNQPNPIKRGGDFKMEIYMDKEMFIMTIDEKPFCTFPYRFPLSDIQRFNIHGDVEEVYEVQHSKVLTAKARRVRGDFSASIPSMSANIATVINGTPRVSETGIFEIALISAPTSQVLMKVTLNFKEKKVTTSSGDDENSG